MHQKFTVDDLMEKTENKYILAEIISQQARYLKREEDISIGYKAINRAIDDLMEDKFSYEEKKK